MSFRYLRPEDIRKLDSFEFAPRLMADGYLAGRHSSRRQGSSTDFRDYRQYVPGDDPARIDWRVYGRTDRFYLRLYDQETAADCHIFLDSSASMGFGKPLTKLAYASFFAAALCYLVTRGNDAVSLQLFDDKIRRFFPPGSTWRHLEQLMHSLENNRPGNRTRLSEALRRAEPLLRKRGTLIIISDFFDSVADIFSALNSYLHRGFDVRLFHILAPEELALEDRGLAAFTDMETGERIIGHSGGMKADYAEAMRRHIAGLRELAVRKNVDYVMVRTTTHYFELFDRIVK